MVKYSIVIPAYNEAELIAQSVKAAAAQNIPRDEFEIIVVDNASTDDTSEAARQAGADKVVLETVKGTNIARQRGVLNSEGEIVAFLDADCQPDNGWLQSIDALLAKPGVAAVSGPYDYGFRTWRSALSRIYLNVGFRHLDKMLYLVFHRRAGVMMGGNFATRREYLDRIGGLPPLKFYGDDAKTAIMLARMVGKVVFTPEITVASSPRRFRSQGFFRLTLTYAWHYFKIYFSRVEPPVSLAPSSQWMRGQNIEPLAAVYQRLESDSDHEVSRIPA